MVSSGDHRPIRSILAESVEVHGDDKLHDSKRRNAGKRLRYWEIDALRGVAIITMIVYHTMWDLWYSHVLPDVVLWEGFWKYWQRFTAGTFLILVGVSLTLVYRRERALSTGQKRASSQSSCCVGLKFSVWV